MDVSKLTAMGSLAEPIADSVDSTSLSVIGSGSAFYSNLAMGNAVAAQHGMMQIQAAIIGKIAESIITARPSNAGIDVEALMQLLKAIQSTSPETNVIPTIPT